MSKLNIPTDKIKHFLVVFDIMLGVGLLSLVMGAIVSIVAMFGKELYDYKHPDKHTAEWGDIYAGMAGFIAAFALLMFLQIVPFVAQAIVAFYLTGITAAWFIKDKLKTVAKGEGDLPIYLLFSWIYFVPAFMMYITIKWGKV